VSWRLDDSVCSSRSCQNERRGIRGYSSRHDLVNMNLCRRFSVVIDRHIISIQFRYENSCYGVKRGWKLPDLSKAVRAAQFKYIEGRNPCDVKALRPRVVDRVIGVSHAGEAV